MLEKHPMDNRLQELEDALSALAFGNADAIVIPSKDGQPPKVVSFENANLPYRVLLDSMAEGAAALTQNAEILYANPSLCYLLGKSSLDEVIGLRLYDIFPEECGGALRILLNSAKDGKVSAEFDCLDNDGALHPAMLSLAPIQNEGQTVGVVALVVDTAEHKKAMQHIQFLAHHDPLTGLPNRMLLADRCKQAVAESSRRKTQIGLLFIDLDRFKNVNDTLGHMAGDAILQMSAKRIQAQIRQEDTLARIGGDEFVVLLSSLTDGKDASNVAAKIVHAFLSPLQFEANDIHISVSIGIAVCPENGHDFFELLKSADTAMYQAKKQGKSRYVFASLEMNQRLSNQYNIEQALRDALQRKEFIPYYQPRVSISQGKLVGAEALVRWKKASGELISPANFIPIAEETGLIDALGRQMLEMVCQQIQQWKVAKLAIVPVSVNVSALQLRADDFIAHFLTTIATFGIQADELELEITESSLIQEGNAPLIKLQTLRDLGHKILLDDFGTGFSSLSYVSRLPFDTIKVAQEFMRHESSESKQFEVVLRAIIALADGLGKNIMVEGIETIDQVNTIAEMGFDEYQGYYFSKPLPAEAFKDLLKLQ